MNMWHSSIPKLAIGLAAVGLVLAGPASAKVEGDTIIIGSAISLTGKYSTNGQNTQKGYDLAVKRINKMGGVKVGGKSYKLKIIYYDDDNKGQGSRSRARRRRRHSRSHHLREIGERKKGPRRSRRPRHRHGNDA